MIKLNLTTFCIKIQN